MLTKTYLFMFIILFSCFARSENNQDFNEFIQLNNKLVFSKLIDLNHNGRLDAVIVLEKIVKNHEDEYKFRKNQRQILILYRNKNGKLKLWGKNNMIISCSECGEPFVTDEDFDFDVNKIIINQENMSFSNKYIFVLSKGGNWYLKKYITNYKINTTDKIKIRTVSLSYPTGFRKIFFSKFNPYLFYEKYLKNKE